MTYSHPMEQLDPRNQDLLAIFLAQEHMDVTPFQTVVSLAKWTLNQVAGPRGTRRLDKDRLGLENWQIPVNCAIIDGAPEQGLHHELNGSRCQPLAVWSAALGRCRAHLFHVGKGSICDKQTQALEISKE